MPIQELVKRIRASKTAAEEREIVNRECAKIRTSFKKDEAGMRSSNIVKLVYFHLLGYPTQFAQVECFKLMASPNYSEKRVGYLALYVLMDENQEVLMLITNSLKNDLRNVNHYIVGLALMAIGNLASIQIVSDCASDVEKFLYSPNPYIRKKAALATTRLIAKSPELLNQFLPYLNFYFREANHAALLAGTTLAIHMAKINPACIPTLKELVPAVIKYLSELVNYKVFSEYSMGPISDPFLQVKFLHFLRLVCVDVAPELKEQIETVLTKILSGTDYCTVIGHAVLYECIKTIIVMESSSYLKTLGILSLEKFFLKKESNYDFVALNILLAIARTDNTTLQRFNSQVLNCLKSEDPIVSRAALNLVVFLTDGSDPTDLVMELLKFLEWSHVTFKQELVLILCQLLAKHPSKQFHVEMMIRIMLTSDEYVSCDTINSFLCFISNNAEIQPHAVRMLYESLRNNVTSQLALIQTAVWCIGEYFRHLIGSHTLRSNDQNPIEFHVDCPQILSTLFHVMSLPSINNNIRIYTLISMTKVVVANHNSLNSSVIQKVHDFLFSYHQDTDFDLQQLSLQLSQIMNNPHVASQVLATPMPPLHFSISKEITPPPPPNILDSAHVQYGSDENHNLHFDLDSFSIAPTPPFQQPTTTTTTNNNSSNSSLLGELFANVSIPPPPQNGSNDRPTTLNDSTFFTSNSNSSNVFSNLDDIFL